MKYLFPVALSLGTILLAASIGAPDACLVSGGGELCDRGIQTLAIVVLVAQILVGGLVIYLVGRGAPASALRMIGPANAPTDDVSVDEERKRTPRMATDAAAPNFRDFMVMNGLRESSPRPADDRSSSADAAAENGRAIIPH